MGMLPACSMIACTGSSSPISMLNWKRREGMWYHFSFLVSVLVEMFEIDPALITPAAHLFDDLDIDSIDAVDLVVKIRELTGRKVKPEEFKQVRTVNDVVDAVEKMLAA
jgi:acyl carrier protein